MRHLQISSGRLRLLCAALLAALGLAIAPRPVEGKGFVFSRVAIDASVGRDGSLRIVEGRTYRFDGQFSWATYRLPLQGTSRMREITVADEKGSPVPFQVSRSGGEVVIRWSFSASNESRTFVIGYVLDDVVRVHGDVAELYWKFIGTGWDRPSEDVRVSVRLPGRVPAGQIRVWGHGPLHGEARRVDGGAVLTVRSLRAGTMVEGRIVFPREVVPQARRRLSTEGLPRILQEEGTWAEQANRERLRQRVLFGGLAGIPVLAVAGWMTMYLRYGREPVPSPHEGYYRDLPADYSPAELGVLWRFGSVQPADFTATVLDLARRGYLTVEAEGTETASVRDDSFTLARTQKASGLRDFEGEALRILFGHDHSAGDRLTISSRSGLPADAKKRMGTRFSTWTRMVAGAAKIYQFFDPTSEKMRSLTIGLGFLLFVGGIAAAIWLGASAGLAGVIIGSVATALSGLVLLIGAFAVARRSQRGADDLRKWQGFRRFLLDFSEMPRAEVPALILWDHYLVYAVPLGVADRVVAQLQKIFPREELVASPTWRTWTSPSSGGGGSSLASFSTFTTAFSAATSSATSSGGGGGGFSGGGGGGGGGSGGSAG